MVAPYSGAMLAMVARSGTDSAAAPWPWNSTNFPTTFALRSISVTVSTRSVAVAPVRSFPERFTPTTSGEEVDRLAQHGRLGLDAADAPGEDAQAVDHGGVRIGAHQRVGIDDALALEDPLGEVLEVHLVHDADARRDDPEAVVGLHAPPEVLVAGPVPLELDAHVQLDGVRHPREIDLHAVIDHQVDRHLGFDQLGILPGP